jgi:polyphosphate kinase
VPGAAIEADSQPQFINREVSWLDFNSRVLALAEDPSTPLLERVKFLAIHTSNLDEYFQIRVAGLKEQVAAGVAVTSPDGMTPTEQLERIRESADEQAARVVRVFRGELVPALRAEGVNLCSWSDLSPDDRAHLRKVFEDQIFPVLTPLSVDPAHPFPYISNLSLNLAVVVRDPKSLDARFARVKVPALLPRFLQTQDGSAFVPLEQVIAAHLADLFPGMEVVSHHVFRITRNADLELEEDEAEDLLEAVETILRLRRLSQMVVRLEAERTMPENLLSLLARELELEPYDVYRVSGLLGLDQLWSIHAIDRPDLKDEPWAPTTQVRLAAPPSGPAVDVFRAMRRGDLLVHHPYDSFKTSVEAFVERAARDPAVRAIKQTLYRTSGRDSPIVHSLIRAAEAGKQVVALVELKARFDEQTNINWARVLEEAGVHVVYGLVGLKTHAKIALVVREEDDGIRLYCHVGTGNYNPTTAKTYEDLGLFTTDRDVCEDAVDLFNSLTGYSRHVDYRKLLVAPTLLRSRLLELIQRETEAGADGRIVIKLNSLVDGEMIRALYGASQAGASVDLIVRGICCLRPGVPGLSQNIRVRSIVGRFLEHSRIFRFGADGRDPVYYLGSADLMPRNLDRRVEAVAPVEDPVLQQRLQEILDVELADDSLAWALGPAGEWAKVPTHRGVNSHRRLQELALRRAAMEPDRS